MIPKIIHYCWFGGNPLPELAQKCIASWEKFCPDYEIKEWNESNFDVNCCEYVKEANKTKKWAFVSDYARIKILYDSGGLYFDTDVELISNLKNIIEKGPFMGFEDDMQYTVAPGLGLGVTPGLPLYKDILDLYNNQHFLHDDGTINYTTIVVYTTNILKKYGLIKKHGIQYIGGVYIYPQEYFCPMNFNTGEVTITNKTVSIHHYSSSWYTEEEKKYNIFGQKMRSVFGIRIGNSIERIYSLPYRVLRKIDQKGLVGAFKFGIKKLFN